MLCSKFILKSRRNKRAFILSRILYMVTSHKEKWEETKLNCLNHCQETKAALTAQVCRERTSPSTLQPSLHSQQTRLKWAKPISCAPRHICSALEGRNLNSGGSRFDWEVSEGKEERRWLNLCLSFTIPQSALPDGIQALRQWLHMVLRLPWLEAQARLCLPSAS